MDTATRFAEAVRRYLRLASNQTVYWVVLVVVIVALLLFEAVPVDQQSDISEKVLALVLIVLLLRPLFVDIDIFGFKVKREIQQFTKEITSEFEQLRVDVQANLIQHSEVNNSPTFNIGMPTDHSIQMTQDAFKGASNAKINEKRAQPPNSSNADRKPSDEDMVIQTRAQLVKRLQHIDQRHNDFISGEPRSIFQVIDDLARNGRLTHATAGLVKDVLAISSVIVNGGSVSETQLRYALEVGPQLVKSVSDIAVD